MTEEDVAFCGNCGNSLSSRMPRTPPYLFLPSANQAPSGLAVPRESKEPEIPDLFPPAGTWDIADIEDFAPLGDGADQYIPSSSASQYPRTPAEQYRPDNRAGQYIPAARASAVEFRPDVRRLSRAEQTAGGATLIVLISLFLPWFGVGELGTAISISGTTAHGYLVVVVLIAVLMAGYLLWRAGWEEFPVSLPVGHETLLLGATALQLLMVAIAFLDVPVAGLSREIGAYLALIAAVAAVGPAVMPALHARQAGD